MSQTASKFKAMLSREIELEGQSKQLPVEAITLLARARDLLPFGRSSEREYNEYCRDALCRAKQGYYGWALGALRGAKLRYDSYARHHHLAGLIHGMKGNQNLACSELKKALDAEPYPEAKERIREAYNLANYVRRVYTVSDLPTMQDAAPPAPADDFRIALYGRICDTWRALVDVRFKLLALVPVVSVLGISKVLEVGKEPSLSRIARTGIAVVGLLATVGLLVYDRRNSELHDDLIGRGRRIEDELRVHTGLFRGRLNPGNRFVVHDRAIALIYYTSLLGWVSAIVAIWAGF